MFRELKKKFTKKPVLVALDLDKKMRLEVDVSDYATGGVISMEGKDGLWRPVVIIVRSRLSSFSFSSYFLFFLLIYFFFSISCT